MTRVVDAAQDLPLGRIGTHPREISGAAVASLASDRRALQSQAPTIVVDGGPALSSQRSPQVDHSSGWGPVTRACKRSKARIPAEFYRPAPGSSVPTMIVSTTRVAQRFTAQHHTRSAIRLYAK